MTPPLHDLDLQLRAKTDRAAMDELVRGCAAFIEAMRRKALTDEQLPALGWDREDAWQVAALAFVKAVRTLDPSNATLGTYSARCIRNELWMVLRAKERHALDAAALEQPLMEDADGNAMTLLDVLAAPDPIQPVEDALAVRQAIDRSLTDRQRRIIAVLAVTEDDARAAAMLGISRSYVSRVRGIARAKVVAELAGRQVGYRRERRRAAAS